MSTANEPIYAKSMREKKESDWYLSNLDKNTTPERDKAWAIRAYPCTGLGLFLSPNISKCVAYGDIVTMLKDRGGIYLDVGAFVGQDMRRLVADGVPQKNLYAIDIVSHWDIGYELFRDRERFKPAGFILADIMDSDNPELIALEGSIDVINITHVLHQWSWDDQVRCCRRLVALSSGVGSMVFGFQNGNIEGFPKKLRDAPDLTVYRHSKKTFASMWDQVGEDTGTKWETTAELRSFEQMEWDPKDVKFLEENCGILAWVVTRKL